MASAGSGGSVYSVISGRAVSSGASAPFPPPGASNLPKIAQIINSETLNLPPIRGRDERGIKN